MSWVAARPDRNGILRLPALFAAAAALPAAGAFLWPAHLQQYEALSWLLLLPAAFHWAYRQAWRGVATGIALGVAIVAITYAVAQAFGREPPDLLLPVVALYALLTLVVGVLTVRLARAEQAAAAERLSLLDELTGLPNRRHAELHLEMEIAAAERGRALSVVMFDLDHMQQYNARNGRAAGDAVLRGFASLLRQQTRRMDLAARCGPEAFVAILAGCMEEGALVFAGRVQEQLRAARQTAVLPTVSAGIAVYTPDMLTAHDVLDAAAHALRLAKSDGRDRVRIHGRGIDELREPDSSAVQRAASESLAHDAATPESAPFDALSRRTDSVGHARTALVATADEAARAALLPILEQEGFHVLHREPTRAAIEQLRQDVDLAFVDLAGDGAAATLVGEIRLRSPTTRVIGITGTGGDDVPAELLRVRVDGLFIAGAGEAALQLQMRELLTERDALTTVQLRQRHLQIGLGAEHVGRHAADARYRALVVGLGDVVFATDANGRITLLNPAWAALSGRTVEESLGRMLWEFVAPADQPMVRTRLERMLAGGTDSTHTAARMETADGGLRWIDVRLHGAGAGGGVGGVICDMTDRRRDYDAMRRREATLQALVEHGDELLAILNADATVRYVTPSARRLLGIDPAGCEGADVDARLHPDDAPAVRDALARLLEEPDAHTLLSVRLRHADGSWRRLDARAHNLLRAEHVEGIVLSARVAGTDHAMPEPAAAGGTGRTAAGPASGPGPAV